MRTREQIVSQYGECLETIKRMTDQEAKRRKLREYIASDRSPRMKRRAQRILDSLTHTK